MNHFSFRFLLGMVIDTSGIYVLMQGCRGEESKMFPQSFQSMGMEPQMFLRLVLVMYFVPFCLFRSVLTGENCSGDWEGEGVSPCAITDQLLLTFWLMIGNTKVYCFISLITLTFIPGHSCVRNRKLVIFSKISQSICGKFSMLPQPFGFVESNLTYCFSICTCCVFLWNLIWLTLAVQSFFFIFYFFYVWN